MSLDNLTTKTITSEMKIECVLSRLAESDLVDGVALYGPRVIDEKRLDCDYDLLVLVKNQPLGLVQVFTHIDGRNSDVLFIDISTYDQVLQRERRLPTTSAEGKLMLKMRDAQIISDRSGRLEKGREASDGISAWFRMPSYSGQYLLWFSQNFTLAQIRRMSRSSDPVYLTAADMMLASAIGSACHAYFDIRQLLWEGEKGAIRYLLKHDSDYLQLLRDCLGSPTRKLKLALYERLVTATLLPFGKVWDNDEAAVCFGIPVCSRTQVQAALTFWETLFS